MSTELAQRNDAPMLMTDQLDVIKRTICPAGIPDVEFRLFIEQCRRSGLDPLQKQMFCVKRRQKVGDRWVEKFEAQPAEAGMLARAEKFNDFRGIQAGAVYAKDAITVHPAEGKVEHAFTPFSDRGKILGAWAKVDRDGRVPTIAVVSFGERVQDQYNWSKMPETMIVKCARVAALRIAYPEAFGGLYISEEMPATEPQAAPRATSQDGETVDTASGEVVATISEAQRKRMWAIACESWGRDNAEANLKALLAEHGINHGKDVPKADYETIIDAIQAAATPAEPVDQSDGPVDEQSGLPL